MKFFVKDPINWGKYERAPFYYKLLHLRNSNVALSADASYKRLATGNDDAIFSYIRQKGKKRVTVVLNLSDQPQQFTIKEKEMYGNATEIFTSAKEKLGEMTVYSLSPWEYRVYEY